MANQPFTCDDTTLLRAIRLAESVQANPGVANNDATIRAFVMERDDFQIIATNDHLRGLLKEFLVANIAVESKVRDIQRERARGIIGRVANTMRMKSLQTEFTILEAIRDAAFNSYEMLRKLTDIDNLMLKRFKASLKVVD